MVKRSSPPTGALLAAITLASIVSATPIRHHRNHELPWTPQNVTWHNCTADFLQVPVVPPQLQCATIEVPLDWDHPHKDTITLGLTKLPTTNSSTKLGDLLVNPGGPGGSAVSAVAYVALGYGYLSPELKASYDIIGQDPRGVGASTPIQCDLDIWNKRYTLFPTTEAEFEELVSTNKALGESCIEKSGDIVKHVDTTSVAKDMEAVRLALGGEKLNYMGFSYGTQIAAAYAELFPYNINRMVMDGQTDHSQSETDMLVTEVNTFETELDRLFTWCRNATSCPLHGHDVKTLYENLLANATVSPLPAPGCEPACRNNVTWEELITNIHGFLVYKTIPSPYDQVSATWATLGAALGLAATGNATLLSTALASTQADANGGLSGLAVGCLDWYHDSNSLPDMLYKTQLTRSLAPCTLGVSQSYQYQSQCLGWPAAVQNPPHKAKVPADAPGILMVQSFYDPETSYVWAENLREEVPSAVLLARDGDGHTSYFLEGEASKIMDRFLVTGVLPEENTVVKS